MSLRLYFTSLFFYSYSISDIFKIATELKFEGIELNPEIYHIWFAKNESKILSEIYELKDSYNLSLTLHAPFVEINLISYNPKIRAISEREIQRAIFWANRLEIPIVTFHMGSFPFGFEYKKDDYFIQKFYRFGVTSLESLYKYATDANVHLGIENLHFVSGKFPKTETHFDLLLNNVPDLEITFDLAHAYTISESTAWSLLDKYSEKIINIHVSDVDKHTRMHHICIGDGFVDFNHFFKLLKQKNIETPIVIELSATAICKGKQCDRHSLVKYLEISKTKLEKSFSEVSS